MSSGETAYGDTVSLYYAIRLRDGTEIISNFDEAEPDTLTIGDGSLAQPLEQWLIGLAPGARHVFLLDPWQAFGARDEELVQTLDPRDIPSELKLEAGNYVEFNLPNGQTLAGTIEDIRPDGVKVDFNHPLAGCPIEFEVEVVQILDAAPQEPRP